MLPRGIIVGSNEYHREDNVSRVEIWSAKREHDRTDCEGSFQPHEGELELDPDEPTLADSDPSSP